MEINGATATGIILVVIVLPFLFSALKESGRIRAPKFGRKPRSSFRQFPTFPVQDDGSDFE